MAVDGVISEISGTVCAIPPGVDKAFLSIHDPAYRMFIDADWRPDLPPQQLPECWDGEVAMMKIIDPEKIPAGIVFPLANKF